MSPSTPFYIPQKIKIFLSYSTIDKNTTGWIKILLEENGFYVFLAHHDLEPSQIWVEEIINNITNCDVFIPILTENSINSFWVNQEIGIGLIKEKFILPLKIDTNPWGFISHLQAFQLKISDENRYNDFKMACQKIEKIIIAKFPEKGIDTKIVALSNSSSFETSNKIALFLSKCSNLSVDQINEIVRIFFSNDQVHESYESIALVEKLSSEYWDLLDDSLKEIL